jgi:hypothetical protein
MSTAAGEQKASRYYPAEEEAIMKKVCAKSNSSQRDEIGPKVLRFGEAAIC